MDDNSLRGVGMFDDNAGAGIRSDKQIEAEVRQIVAQILRIRGASQPDDDIAIHVAKGKVRISGAFPDRGTRRLVLLAAASIPSVTDIDSSALLPTSTID